MKLKYKPEELQNRYSVQDSVRKSTDDLIDYLVRNAVYYLVDNSIRTLVRSQVWIRINET